MLNLKGNKRIEGEDYKNYRLRLTQENKILKVVLKGKMIWDSKDGPYHKEVE